jgi:hypothetical protein
MDRIAPSAIPQRETMWRKSSFCQQGECAEVALVNGEVIIRSTRLPAETVSFTVAEWQAFLVGVRAREFDQIG